MKKHKRIIGLIISLFCLVGCSSPKTEFTHINVYSPDGAPALGLSYLMSKELFDNQASYEIIDSSLITTYVTGENPRADIAIIPVNIALTKQEIYKNYQILGSITHGNLYILSKENVEISTTNLSSLIGESVGVININNVPGIFSRIILDKNNIPYNIVKNDGTIVPDKVNLIGIEASQIGVDESMKYYVAAEPAASLKVKMLSAKGLKMVGSLQDLYSEDKTYLQAIVVARRNLIANNKLLVDEVVSQFKETKNYLENCDVNEVIRNVQSHLTEGLAPTFNDKNLNAQTIKNCNVFFKEGREIKELLNQSKLELSAYAKVLEDISNYIYE